MKVFVCNCLPNGLESGGIVVAENEAEAKLKLQEMATNDGWEVDADKIQLVEIDLSKPNAIPVDPNGYNFNKKE